MDYYFHESTQTSSTGLPWRTAEDSQSAKGWSGSVLRLGTPLEDQPLLFQNYQCPFHVWPPGHGPNQDRPATRVKGGFLLLTDIREAEILLVYKTTSSEKWPIQSA